MPGEPPAAVPRGQVMGLQVIEHQSFAAQFIGLIGALGPLNGGFHSHGGIPKMVGLW